MKRRLILARALVNRPDLLILDEPTIGLDPQARHLLWDRLRLLKEQGNTVILTTHYMDEAARLCDRLVIMDNGRILVEGSPGDLIRDHIGDMIVEVEKTDGIIAFLTDAGVLFEVFGETIQITGEEAQDMGRTLFDRFRPRRIITRPATLEDIFLKLTGRELREGS